MKPNPKTKAKSHRPTFKALRRRKADLIAPACRPDCQVNHTIEQTAALLCCSPDTVVKMIEAGRLAAIHCGIGLQKKSRRVPHASIRALLEA